MKDYHNAHDGKYLQENEHDQSNQSTGNDVRCFFVIFLFFCLYVFLLFFYFFACLLVLFCLFFIYCNVCNFVSFYRISFPLLHPAFCTTRQAASTIFIGVQTFTSISALSLHQIPLCVYVSSFISPLELMKLDKWKVHCRGRIQSFWNVNLSTFSQSRIHLLIYVLWWLSRQNYILWSFIFLFTVNVFKY